MYKAFDPTEQQVVLLPTSSKPGAPKKVAAVLQSIGPHILCHKRAFWEELHKLETKVPKGTKRGCSAK